MIKKRLVAQWLMTVAIIYSVGLIRVASAQEKRPPPAESDSIVPENQRVSQREAKLVKARLLATKDETIKRSEQAYRELAASYPDDAEIRQEFASVLMRLLKFDEAQASWQSLLRVQPDSYVALLNSGKCYLWTGSYHKAAGTLQRAAGENPEEKDPHQFLARAFTALKEHERAISHAEIYNRRAGSNNFEGLAELGDAYFGASKFPEAIQFYRSSLEAKAPKGSDSKQLAIKKRIGLALSWIGSTAEALVLLQKLHEEDPNDDQVAIELARGYSRQGDFTKVVPTLNKLLGHPSANGKLSLDAADLFLAIGHYDQALELYEKTVEADPNDLHLSLLFADRMNSWGAFDEAANRYRTYLKANPDDTNVMLRLAQTLVSSEQFEDAESLYRIMLARDNSNLAALRGFALLKLQQGEQDISQNFALVLHSEQADDLLASGEILSRKGDYARATSYFKRAASFPDSSTKAQKRLAEVQLKLGNENEAKAIYRSILEKTPHDVESQYHLKAQQTKLSSEDVLRISTDESLLATSLLQWGQIATKNGDISSAISFYNAAIKRDPSFVPAKIALAELLGIESRYDEAISVYDELVEAFPTSTKIRVERARTLAFAKRYDESIAAFEAVHVDYPTNHIVLREAARTAMWARRFSEAKQKYQKMLTPSVSQQLQQVLTAEGLLASPSNAVQNLLRTLQSEQLPHAYSGFENALASLESTKQSVAGAEREKIELSFAALYGEYLRQKTVALELASKESTWQKRPNDARKSLEELIKLEPGNKEAIFELAQVTCAQGERDAAKGCYDRLLTLAPLHKVAPEARQQLTTRDGVTFLGSFYARSEDGRGELARFTRSLATAGVDVPLDDSTKLAVLANYWREVPYRNRTTYTSLGPTLELNKRFNQKWKGNIRWSYRMYEDDEFDARNLGAATAWYQYDDWLAFSGGYERSDEIYNRYGLEKGIQSDNVWFGAEGRLTRDLEYRLNARQVWYTDSNSGQRGSFELAQALSDQPRTFKLGVRAEYYDSASENQFVSGENGITDIVHPYWTPYQYGAGFLTIDWRHDLSEIVFCQQRKHYYQLRFAPFVATDGNTGGELSAEWMIELPNQLGIGLQGSIQRSELYDAEQGLFFVRYVF